VGRSGRVSESLADGQAATGRPTATDNQAQCQWAAGLAAARGGLGVSVPLRVGVAAATERLEPARGQPDLRLVACRGSSPSRPVSDLIAGTVAESP
jgi:hypothetical protein